MILHAYHPFNYNFLTFLPDTDFIVIIITFNTGRVNRAGKVRRKRIIVGTEEENVLMVSEGISVVDIKSELSKRHK